MCPACGGQGTVLIIPPAKNCAYCNGRGKVDHLFDLFFTKPCPACSCRNISLMEQVFKTVEAMSHYAHQFLLWATNVAANQSGKNRID